jgi:hypothetical protein
MPLLCASSSFIVTGSATLLWSLDALIFDGDDVILQSEHLHRQAYNDSLMCLDFVGAATEGKIT